MPGRKYGGKKGDEAGEEEEEENLADLAAAMNVAKMAANRVAAESDGPQQCLDDSQTASLSLAPLQVAPLSSDQDAMNGNLSPKSSSAKAAIEVETGEILCTVFIRYTYSAFVMVK